MTTINFTDQLFHYNVTVLIGTVEELSAWESSQSLFVIPDKANQKGGTIINNSRKEVLIYVTKDDASLLSRQVFNAVMLVLHNEGIDYADNNSNIFASLIEFYSANIFKQLKETI